MIVKKMLYLIERIQGFCKNISYEEFVKNDILIDACVFNLSQLGEAANKIDEGFEKRNPQIPWRQIYGLRNRIVHDYEGVNLKLVWEIIETDLSDIQEELIKLQNE